MGPVRSPRYYVPLIRFLIFLRYIYCLLVLLYASSLVLFLHFLLTYLARVFLCCSTFLLIGECMLLLCSV